MHDFQKGEGVRSTSGGPAMAVFDASRPNSVGCEWWVDGKPIREDFDPEMLKRLPNKKTIRDLPRMSHNPNRNPRRRGGGDDGSNSGGEQG
jgi:uncharacterized protein YodC (DUF2158 family)